MPVKLLTATALLVLLSSCADNVRPRTGHTPAAKRMFEASCFYNSMALQMFAEAYRLGADKQKLHFYIRQLRDEVSENSHIRKINNDAYSELFSNKVKSTIKFANKYYSLCAAPYVHLDHVAVSQCMRLSYIQRLSYIARKKGISKNRFISTLITHTGYTNEHGLKKLSRLVGIVYEAPDHRSALKRIYITFDICRRGRS